MYDLIVIGGGAAALSATAFALGKRLKVLMIYESLGGKTGQHLMLPDDAEGAVGYLVGHMMVYLSQSEARPVGEPQLVGEEAARRFERQIERSSGATLADTVVEVTRQGESFEVLTLNHGARRAAAVIVATGVTPQRLDVPGAQSYLDHGLSYSTTTYARLLAGKRAAVIGATARALRGAAELAHTAAQVYLILPEPVSLSAPLLDALRMWPNVDVLEGYRVVAIEGDAQVRHVVVERHERRRALPVDAAFIALGLRPNSESVRRLAKTSSDGFIWVDEARATTAPGLFAAGDVTTAFAEQSLIAVGDGLRAALSAYDYLLTRAPRLFARD